MRLLVDNQLPTALARWLSDQQEDAIHVMDCALDCAADADIWRFALSEGRIVVSKDEDFFHLANRRDDVGRLLWVRLGNCRRDTLLARFSEAWVSIRAAFASGQRIVELR